MTSTRGTISANSVVLKASALYPGSPRRNLTTFLRRGAALAPPHPAFGDAPFRVYRSGAGYVTDFDWEPPTDQITGATYFVDPVSGSDSNTGLLPSLPLLKITTAIQKSDRGRILIKGGNYWIARGTDSFQTINWGTAPISLEGWGGPVRIASANKGSDYGWTDLTGGAFKITAGLGSATGALYLLAADPNVPELPQTLTKRADLAAVQAAGEGFWTDDVDVIVKIPGGTTPAIASVLILRAAGAAVYTGSLMYQRGISWIGSGTGNRHVPVATTRGTQSIYDDCVFSHGYVGSDYDALGIVNVEMTALRNCRAYYGAKDLFNYHGSPNLSFRQFVLEQGCTAKYSAHGRAEVRGPYQASTTHDGITAVRVGGTYGPTLGGPAIQDQGTDANNICRSWQVGCTMNAVGSPATVGELGVIWGYPHLGGVFTESWDYDCTLTEGVAGPAVGQANGPIYVRKSNAWTVAPGVYVYPY